MAEDVDRPVLSQQRAAAQAPLDRSGAQPDRDELAAGDTAALEAGDRRDLLIARAGNDHFVAQSENCDLVCLIRIGFQHR